LKIFHGFKKLRNFEKIEKFFEIRNPWISKFRHKSAKNGFFLGAAQRKKTNFSRSEKRVAKCRPWIARNLRSWSAARISAGNSGEQEARKFPLRNGRQRHLVKFARGTSPNFAMSVEKFRGIFLVRADEILRDDFSCGDVCGER
jgi:hypothetical protein